MLSWLVTFETTIAVRKIIVLKKTLLVPLVLMTLVLVRTENPTPVQAAAENHLILAVPAMTPPVIDGVDTTDDEWESAHRLTGWADNILGVANKDRSFVNVGHDQETLYVRIVYPNPEAFRRNTVFYSESPLKVDVNEREGDIFQDD